MSDDLLQVPPPGGDFAKQYLTASSEIEPLYEAVETRMAGRSLAEGASVRGLTDRERAKQALQLPVEVGTKVLFASNIGAILTYDDPPAPNASGVVVAVKSASGQVTSHNDRVFVKWENGHTQAIHAEHLRLGKGRVRTTKMADRIRVASLGDLTDFLKVSSGTLVHRATKDLWKVSQDGSDFVIERLFQDNGRPLKV
jgi:hypothetical protein